MQYLPLLKVLRGQAAMLEVGDVSRQSVEVVAGFIWDVFFNDSLLLMITFKDDNVEKLTPPVPAGQQVPPKQYEAVREFSFKWIRVANIIAVTTDANVTVNRAQRSMKKLKNEPLYTDDMTQWQTLNNALCRHIINRLKELGLEGTFPGAFKNEQNDLISFADAFAPFAAPTAGSPTPAALGA